MPRWLGLAPAHSRNCRAESLSQSILETSAPPNSANWNWSARRDRKSTRLNSSHGYISYAVFCLKKKKMHVVGRATAQLVVHLENRDRLGGCALKSVVGLTGGRLGHAFRAALVLWVGR